MKVNKVIAYENYPARFPIGTTVVGWLLLDRFKVPGWAWGVFWTLIGLIWIASLYIIVWRQEQVDLFEKNK